MAKRKFTSRVVDPWIDARFIEWSQWRLRRLDGGPAKYGTTPLVALMKYGARVDRGTGVDGGEDNLGDVRQILQTQTLVEGLDDNEQAVIAGYWLLQVSARQIAQQLGWCMQRVTDTLAGVNAKAHAYFSRLAVKR